MADQIEHVMNAVGQIHIQNAAFGKHCLGAGGTTAQMGMTGRIIMPNIGFGFANARADHCAIRQTTTEQTTY